MGRAASLPGPNVTTRRAPAGHGTCGAVLNRRAVAENRLPCVVATSSRRRVRQLRPGPSRGAVPSDPLATIAAQHCPDGTSSRRRATGLPRRSTRHSPEDASGDALGGGVTDRCEIRQLLEAAKAREGHRRATLDFAKTSSRQLAAVQFDLNDCVGSARLFLGHLIASRGRPGDPVPLHLGRGVDGGPCANRTGMSGRPSSRPPPAKKGRRAELKKSLSPRRSANRSPLRAYSGHPQRLHSKPPYR